MSHYSARSPLAVDAKVNRSRESQAETQVRTVLIRGPFFYGVMLARGFSLARLIARSGEAMSHFIAAAKTDVESALVGNAALHVPMGRC